MSTLVDLAQQWLRAFEWFVLAYFVVLNSSYLVLTGLAAVDFGKYLRRIPFAGHDDVFANPLTPGVSVIVPAYNEAAGIVDNVRAMLSLHFPLFEIVVVDDGSTDATFHLLASTFDLVEVPRHEVDVIPTMGAISSVHRSRSGESLVVVRKENARNRSDAINAGLNVARMPLVCVVDADSLLDPSSLLHVVKPFVDDPQHVVATGGVVRPANGCRVEGGHVVETGMPRNWWARIQTVEYLRSFLLGRTGWSSLQSLLIISGAFGMFRRDLVLELGGLDTDCMGEDAELVARIHHHLRKQGRHDYRIVFVSEPVCWTEVPSSRAVLGRQRKRWSRGLAEVMWKHRAMVGNPRYGRIGMLVMPYYLAFELLGPIIELLGVATVVGLLGLWGAGEVFHFHNWLINTEYAALFGIVALGYGLFLSMAALTVEEFSFHRMSSWRDLGVSVVASIAENVGYRQLHCWWRLQGLWWWVSRGESNWGTMPRTGFLRSTAVPTTSIDVSGSSGTSGSDAPPTKVEG